MLIEMNELKYIYNYYREKSRNVDIKQDRQQNREISMN